MQKMAEIHQSTINSEAAQTVTGALLFPPKLQAVQNNKNFKKNLKIIGAIAVV